MFKDATKLTCEIKNKLHSNAPQRKERNMHYRITKIKDCMAEIVNKFTHRPKTKNPHQHKLMGISIFLLKLHIFDYH